MLLSACSNPTPSGEIVGSGSTLSSTSSAALEPRSEASSSVVSSLSTQEYQEAMDTMELSYDDAVYVRDLTLDLWEEFDLETQAILIDVIEIFSDDIDLLGYYVEVAEHEPLTEEELELVFNLMIDIEDGMNILASAIETLL